MTALKPTDLYLVVMAGGSGTRFWPKSTSRRPKQLLSFGRNEKQSLLQQTVARFEGLVAQENQMIITTELLSKAIEAELPRVKVLAEPQGRNTAPCVYWAARAVAVRNPKGILLVMPADHYIPQLDRFRATVMEAANRAATQDELVTLGIRPTRPETGYGYLKLGNPVAGACTRVEAFVEKPNLSRAQEYVQSGQYLWNGGMFVWSAETILKAFDHLMPEMKKAWDEAGAQVEAAYPKLTATSIDYGVMEKAKNVVTYPLDCGWDDVGSWTSLEALKGPLRAEHASGVVMGGELIAIESSGLIVDMPGHLVATLGVKDLIIVESGDSILIADKSRAQDIRKVVDEVKKSHPELV